MSGLGEKGDEHVWAQQALPWLLNRTLPAADAHRLRAHLRGCAECQEAYQIEFRLAEKMAAASVVDYAPQASLAKLMQRIDAEPAPAVAARAQPKPARRSPRAYAAFAQAAALAVLALSVSWFVFKPESAAPGEYHTLSSAAAILPPHLQVVFSDPLTIGEQRALLQQMQGQIISGPSSAGLFLVTFAVADPASLAAAAEQLRGLPGVRFVAVPPMPVPAS